MHRTSLALLIGALLLAACSSGGRSSGFCGGVYGEYDRGDCDPQYRETLERVQERRYFPQR